MSTITTISDRERQLAAMLDSVTEALQIVTAERNNLRKRLTDDEIDGVGVNFPGNYRVLREFARALDEYKESAR